MHDDVKKKINSNRSLNNSGDLKIENRMSVSNNHGQRLHKVNNILKIAQLCSFQTYEKTLNIPKKSCQLFQTKLAFCLFFFIILRPICLSRA